MSILYKNDRNVRSGNFLRFRGVNTNLSRLGLAPSVSEILDPPLVMCLPCAGYQVIQELPTLMCFSYAGYLIIYLARYHGI